MLSYSTKFFACVLLTLVLCSSWTDDVSATRKYYNILQGGTLQEIEKEEQFYTQRKKLSDNARLGALTMKKAELLINPAEKLSHFRKGKTLLEQAILEAPTNIEFRFLRLIIQEKAPSFLQYNQNIQEDVSQICVNYKTLEENLKKVVFDFAQQSKYLKAQDLK